MICLTGLDGSNPLAFLAALGTLCALEDRGLTTRLSWENRGVWRPVLHGLDSLDELVDQLWADLQTWDGEPALQLSYRKGNKTERDLKPPPERMSEYLRQMRALGGRSAALAGAFGSDLVTDNNGATKPTAFHFTAGQQRFLTMAEDLRRGLTREDFVEALAGPWRWTRELPVFAWDGSGARGYALRATDPSKDKKTGVPAADWLALLGLRLFPVTRTGDHLRTTGFTGGWKDGQFTWLIWEPPLTSCTVASLLQHATLAATAGSRARLGAWGVATAMESKVTRTDQGGYGSFNPPRVLW